MPRPVKPDPVPSHDLDVACPRCGAPVGQRCIEGKQRRANHGERWAAFPSQPKEDHR